MADDEKAKRLAAQLRANLHRRKQQVRSVVATPANAPEDQRQGSSAAAAAQAPLAE